MRRIKTEVLLNKLKTKYNTLGRVPSKEDIDKDKTMPHSDTYFTRFGGITNALIEAGITPKRLTGITLERALELAVEFYEKHNRVPSVVDFDNTSGYPHSSIVRDTWGITWNQFLIMAGLPTFTLGYNWTVNRKAELLVKDILLKNGYKVTDLSEENTNADYSFIVNDKITIDVRSSSPIYEQKRDLFRWNFNVNKKHMPDYFILLGLDDKEQIEGMFLIPSGEITARDKVCMHFQRLDRSKYKKYLVEDLILDV